MKTLEEIINYLRFCTIRDSDRCLAAANSLEALAASGVFVEAGSRAWAYAMMCQGKRIKHKAWVTGYVEINSSSGSMVDDDGARIDMFRHDGYTLAPPPEREVTAWEACKAWHEGKEVRFTEGGVWWTKKQREAYHWPFFCDKGQWYIREPQP